MATNNSNINNTHHEDSEDPQHVSNNTSDGYETIERTLFDEWGNEVKDKKEQEEDIEHVEVKDEKEKISSKKIDSPQKAISKVKDKIKETIENIEKEEENEDDADATPADTFSPDDTRVQEVNELKELMQQLGIKKGIYLLILRKYVAKDYKTEEEKINRLNQLMKHFGLNERYRESVIYGQFEKSLADLGLAEDEAENTTAQASPSGLGLKANNELVEVPITRPDGTYARDIKGNVITVRITKQQYYWQMQEERSKEIAKKSNNADGMTEMLFRTLIAVQQDRIQKAERSDPIGTIKGVLGIAQEFGYTKDSPEKDVAKIQAQGTVLKDVTSTVMKEVSPEIRSTVKDVLSELKDVYKLEQDREQVMRNNGGRIPNIPDVLNQDEIIANFEQVLANPNRLKKAE